MACQNIPEFSQTYPQVSLVAVSKEFKMLAQHTATLNDGFYEYRFHVQSIDERPALTNVVYAFVSFNGHIPIKYIGNAKDLRERLRNHDQIFSAKILGADQLWVHRPGSMDPVHFENAEVRLIRSYQPPLNTQHVYT